MNTEQIEKLKKVLEAEREMLEKALGEIGVQNPDNGEWEAIPDMSEGQETDENDLADRAEQFEERSSILPTLSIRLSEVLSALGKMKDGKYGICEISGEPIEEERLLANPAAKTCIAHMNG